ncbi:MAG: hypothetical protein ACJ79G_07315 [Myxococcales bacterium]
MGLYKRFGFEIEGTHKKHAFRDGELVDAFAMARVRFVRNPLGSSQRIGRVVR